jgi:hypothetical protein
MLPPRPASYAQHSKGRNKLPARQAPTVIQRAIEFCFGLLALMRRWSVRRVLRDDASTGGVQERQFLRRSLAAYELEADAAFAERTIFLARLRALCWLAGAVRQPWDTEGWVKILRTTLGTD